MHTNELIKNSYPAPTSMDPGRSAGVWFLHCRLLQGPAGPGAPEPRCPRTPMRGPLSTLDLHGFLRLMEAPLVVSPRQQQTLPL